MPTLVLTQVVNAVRLARSVPDARDIVDELTARGVKLGPGHLATAWAVGADLRAVVTYDARMTVVAAAVGLPVSGPR